MILVMESYLRMPELEAVRNRLDRGEQFNAYESPLPGQPYSIGIGPVSDFLRLATTRAPEVADMIVDALRVGAGQQPQQVRLCESKTAPEFHDEYRTHSDASAIND